MSPSPENSDDDSQEISDDDGTSLEVKPKFSAKRSLDNTASTSNKKMKTNDSKQNKKDLYKPPTTEELNYLKETENLYNSNLFRLQIEELLTQINLKSERVKQIQIWWEKFQLFVSSLEPKDDVEFEDVKEKKKRKKLTERQKFINELFCEKVNFNVDQNMTLKFSKPERAQLFGAHLLNVTTKTDLHLNITIKMPAICFRQKDYLNNRYFMKRHFYSVFIFHELKNSTLCDEINFLYYGGNKLMPFIQVVPKFSDAMLINIFISGSESYFKLSRFRPNRNNIKKELFEEFDDINAIDFDGVGTPLYNAILARDLTLHLNYSYMANVLNLKNVQDGIKLLNVWLTQRELNKGFGNFNSDILFYVMTYLMIKKKINPQMSSYQVIRIFWTFLCNTNWHEEPVCIAEDVKQDILMAYKDNYDVTFLDYSGFYNVTAFVNLDVYLKVRSEAQLALSILNDNKFDSFNALFILRLPFAVQYDAVLKLKDEDNFAIIYKSTKINTKWKYYGFHKMLITNEIVNILKQALTQRACNIIPYITEQNSLETDLKELKFGINLNPSCAFNIIEKGPLEDDPKSVEFRQFWKGLSEFRRFEDGTVREAVYFETCTILERRRIFKEILNFIFGKKFKLNMMIVADEFEEMLQMKNRKTIPFPIGTNEEACLKIKGAYDELSKKLRNLKLPLPVTSMQGTSDSFSYTELFPPLPANYYTKDLSSIYGGDCITLTDKTNYHKLPNYVAPLEFIVQLGISSKWPNDLTALQNMKTQFYFEISKLLADEHNIPSIVKFKHLDLLYEGLVFRLMIFVPKEINLAKKCTNDEGVVVYKDNEASFTLEKELEILPKVTSALNGVQLLYPSFGPSSALIKRWLRSQLLDSSHISDIVLNLLNASVYLNSEPFVRPNLPQIGFLRFLKFLVEVNWNLNPIIVNFNNDIDNASLNEMEVNFQQNRQNYPCLYIITPYNSGKSVFTKNHPSKQVLKRITLLATEAYKFILDSLMEWKPLKIKELFLPNIRGYDVLIHLRQFVITNQHQLAASKQNNETVVVPYDKNKSNLLPVVDFDPVKLYLTHLRTMYGKFALFFNDSYGGNVIGVLWSKKALDVTDFKILNSSGMKYVDGKLELNRDALLQDFLTAGKEIVKTVDTCN